MRTTYLGDTFRKQRATPTKFERHYHVEPEGDDIPVFDRQDTGGRGAYDRPWREDEAVELRRGRYKQDTPRYWTRLR